MTETSKEFRVFGPPGTGKTTYLARQIVKACDAYGPHRVMVASFTKAAVAELNTRNLPIPDQNLGTLHSLAYRTLDYPEIVETGKHFKVFNETAPPNYKLSAPSRNDVDDGYAAAEGASEGDKLLRDLQRRRAMMQSRELWPEELKGFANAWSQFKHDAGGMDFTDLIERAYHDVSHPPGAPDVGFFDEAQDFTPLELALVRKWSAGMERIVLSMDDDQTLYNFKGASARLAITPLPPENIRILKQSYRVPIAVHELAEVWIKQIPDTHRQPKEYLPRDYPGEVIRTAHHHKDPKPLLDMVQPYLAANKSVLFLASCSYMLAPLLEVLRDAGLPFSNPYRRRRLDWNPLYRPDDKYTAVARVEAFLSNLTDWDLQWTGKNLALWLPLTKGVFIRGKKTAGLAVFRETHGPIPWEQLRQYIPQETIDAMLQGGLRWLRGVLGAEWTHTGAYACAVAARGGLEALSRAEEPNLRLGTIHSLKGGESDVVVLFPDMSYQGYIQYLESTEGAYDAVRLFYVGMTRARESLILAAPAGRMAVAW
jgi:DNA helicase II / ATP-dependent DNA helicase PcrA